MENETKNQTKAPLICEQTTRSNNTWTFDIPAKEHRLFLLDREKVKDRLWLLTDNATLMKEGGMFTKAFNVTLEHHPDECEEMLAVLANVTGFSFDMEFPPKGENRTMQGMISAIAQLIQYKQGFESKVTPSKLPKKASSSVEILVPGCCYSFSVNTSEPTHKDGNKMPINVWLEGDYPEVLSGLCALLSFNMAKGDVSRMSVILKALIANSDTGDKQTFYSPVSAKKVQLSSMGAYIVDLVLHRYMANFYLDMKGDVLPEHNVVALHSSKAS